MMSFAAVLMLLSFSPQTREVTLPLADYVNLLETAEAVEGERVRSADNAGPVFAELISQHASVVWEERSAAIEARFVVKFEGRPKTGVFLPITGFALTAAVEPENFASLQRTEGGVRLVAAEPGTYTVKVESRAPFPAGNASQLQLAPRLAPVGDVEISLPETRGFECPEAVVAEQSVRDGRRIVSFTSARGKSPTVRARLREMRQAPDALVASSSVVSILELNHGGMTRHDVVLYEVNRGMMDTFVVTIPVGLNVERVATDEGDVLPLVESTTLRVHRRSKLNSHGYLILSSPLAGFEAFQLDPVLPDVGASSRFFAVASTVAGDVVPDALEEWSRVDLSDLPETLAESLGELRRLRLQAAWRARGPDTSSRIDVSTRALAPQMDTVITSRESISVLTPAGSLVHRDRFTLDTRESVFRLRLPPGGVVWTASVNDTLVRPTERDGELVIPLGLPPAARRPGDDDTVEIVFIQSQELVSRQTKLVLTPARVEMPVYRHRWRLMLPEGYRYRWEAGDLAPSDARDFQARTGEAKGASHALGMGGSAGIRGHVFDAQGLILPGATVTVHHRATDWTKSVVANEYGGFWFSALPSGEYSLECSLSGFSTLRFDSFRIHAGQTPTYALTLGIASIAETVSLTAEAPAVMLGGLSDSALTDDPTFSLEAFRLRQGLVGGVKPIPVTIPESGKTLLLGAALPPAEIRVELLMKPN